MQRHIDLAASIVADSGKNWLPVLREHNLNDIFLPIYKLDTSTETMNLIVAFIVYSFHPDSPKADLRRDRIDNKKQIAESIGLDIKEDFVLDIVQNNNDKVKSVSEIYIGEFFDWRFVAIYTSVEYASRMFRFINKETDEEKSFQKMDKEGTVKNITQDYDIDTISKVNIQKAELRKKAIEAMEDAERLLTQLKKDLMQTEHAVQSDLGFSFIDTSKKKSDIMSWKEYIKEKNSKKLIAQ